MIQLTITGITETQNFLNGIVNRSVTNSKQILTEASNYMVNQAKNNAHVITGNMKNSIQSNVSDKKATVTASADYSAYENARSGTKFGLGTHDFWNKALNSLLEEIPNICKRNSYRYTGVNSSNV